MYPAAASLIPNTPASCQELETEKVSSAEESYINIVSGLPSSIPNALLTFPSIVIAEGGIESSQTTKPAHVYASVGPVSPSPT